jgi:hypothetical protein
MKVWSVMAGLQEIPPYGSVPNVTTRKAIAEPEAGKGKRFTRVEGLLACD